MSEHDYWDDEDDEEYAVDPAQLQALDDALEDWNDRFVRSLNDLQQSIGRDLTAAELEGLYDNAVTTENFDAFNAPTHLIKHGVDSKDPDFDSVEYMTEVIKDVRAGKDGQPDEEWTPQEEPEEANIWGFGDA